MTVRAAFQRATDTLEQLVEQARRTHRYRLPNVSQLCAQAGVCNVTMLKAVRRLKERGVLSVGHGRGIRVVSPTPATAARAAGPSPSPALKWQRLRVALDRDIVQGVYPTGAELPSPKELAARYAVCYRTLKKALDSLVERGDVVPCRRTYRVPVFSSAQHASSIVLLGAPPSRSPVLEPSSRTSQYLRILEQECSRSGIRLATLSPEQSIDQLHREDAVLGSVLWASGVAEGSMAGTLEHLARSGKPVSVFDDVGSFRPPPTTAHRFRVFSVANSPEPGRRAGRYLLNLGHRTIAYVSPYHRDAWSQRRLEGLRRACECSGLHDSVRPFVLHSTPYPAPVMGSALALQGALDSLLARAPLLRREPGSNADLIRTAQLLHAQLRTLRRAAIRDRLGPLLESAVAGTGITAWVAANDAVAVECVELLNQCGRRVPRDVSVMGFDDGMEALLSNLTSYNFNAQGVMHAMLGHILTCGPRRGTARAVRPVEIEGFITERGTTAAKSSSR